MVYWAARALPGWLILLAIEAAWLLAGSGAHQVRTWLLVGTAVAALLHLSVMPQWRYHVHRWEVTPIAVYTQSGWFNQVRRIAPISRIQTVDSERGPWQLFGLANVTVTTASAAGPVHIHALPYTTAAGLVAELTATTATMPGDAT
jgi:membrane protein YdbS with pleckstrin-like domain